jgi:hypothetical protein
MLPSTDDTRLSHELRFHCGQMPCTLMECMVLIRLETVSELSRCLNGQYSVSSAEEL